MTKARFNIDCIDESWPPSAVVRDQPEYSWWARVFVSALFAPLAVLARPGTRRVLLAILLLDVPLQIGVHFWNREDIAETGGLGGVNISVTTVMLALLFLSHTIEFAASRHLQTSKLVFSKPLTLYVAVAALSCAYATDTALAWFEVALFIQMLLLFLYVANWIRSKNDFIFIVQVLLVGLLLESVLMLWLAHRGSGLDIPGMRARLDEDSGAMHLPRVGGSIGAPNGAGAYLSIMLSIAFGVMMSKLPGRMKLLAAAAFAPGFIALLMTYSRGGFSALVIAVAITLIATMARNAAHWRWLLFLAPVPVASMWFLHSSLATRWTEDDNGAAYSRVPLMRLAFRIIADHPLFGVGTNNFAEVVMNQYATGEFRHAFLYTVHNKYLLIWAETGPIGIVIYLWFLLSTLRRGWQCWKVGDSVLSPVVLGMTAGIVGHMSQMFMDAFRGRPLTQLVWLVAALILAAGKIMLPPDPGARVCP